MALALLVLYVLSDVALRPIAESGSDVIPWYPGAGIALGFLVLAGISWAPVLVAARLLLYFLPHPGATVATPGASVAIAEAALHVAVYAGASVIIRRRVLEGLAAWRVSHAGWLLGAIAVPALLAGTVSAAQAMVTRDVPLASAVRLALTFAAGDAAGALIVLPMILIATGPLLGVEGVTEWPWRSAARITMPDVPPEKTVRVKSSSLTRIGQVTAVAAAMLFAMSTLGSGDPVAYVRLACLIPLAWVAIREGIWGSAIVLAAYGLACLALAASGRVDAAVVPEMTATLLTLGVVGLLLGAARTESAESAARYWDLLAASEEGVWRVDSAGQSLYVNRRMAQILGTTAREIMGREVREFIAPEERARWDLERARRLAGRDSVYETTVLRGDGSRARVLVRGCVVRSTAGVEIGAIALVTDVTALRQAEAERHRAQLLLEAAFRSSRDAMILFRADDGCIVDVNAVWCQLTGYSREEVIGRSHLELQVWSDPEDSARLRELIREHGAVRDFEIGFNRNGGSGAPERGHALLSAAPAEVDGVTYLLVSGRDITSERRREDTERQIRRLEELGRLAGSVSHDFNNLLTVVGAYAQIAKASIEAGEPVAVEDLEEIERAAARGHELTRRLLAFSRHQAIEQRVVDLREIVERANGMMKSVLGHAELRVEDAGTPLPILADPSQVDQVLLNLAVNARDAMPDGGTVTVSTALVHAEPGEVAELIGPDALPGDYAMLRVRDVGMGMDDATAARIFEPFFTTKANGTGTGIGLAVVMGIVRQARGTIRVDTAPARGTTFTIYWPLASLAPAPAEEPEAPAGRISPAPRSGLHVLLVEDEATVQRVARRVLEDAGHRVYTAANGLRALDCLAELEEAGTRVDVVVSDVTMPQMGGLELAACLADRAPGLPVVLMSAQAGAADARDRLSNVPLPVLLKPFQVGILLSAVTTAVTQFAREREPRDGTPRAGP